MGCPGESTAPIYANHREMIRYTGLSDPNFLLSRNTLRGLAFDAVQQPILAKKECRRIRTSLGLTDTAEQNYEELLQSWDPDTCRWIFEEQSNLASWFRDTRTKPMTKPTIFWLYGRPEAGKSVLSAVICEHVVSHITKHCSFFHVEAGESDSTSLDVALKSFAYHISLWVPPFRRALADITRQKRYLSQSCWKKTWELIISLLRDIGTEDPIYWIIDGIDHCPDAKKFISALASMSALNIPLHVLIVSRDTQELHESFQRLGSSLTLESMDLTSHHHPEHDLQLFVTHIVEEHCDSDRDAIIHNILSAAEGNFLCARILCNETTKIHRLDSLKAMLKSAPRNLQAYWRAMDEELESRRDEVKEFSAVIMPWILCVREPLRINSMREGMSCLTDGGPPAHLQRTIRIVCGRFVIINETSQVKFVHSNARNYILTEKSILSVDMQQGHYEIFQSCLNALKSAKYEHGAPVCEKFSFLEYAAKYWHYHLSELSTDTEKVITLMIDFFRTQGVLTWVFLVSSAGNLEALTEAYGILSKFIDKNRTELTLDQTFFEQCCLDLAMLEGQHRGQLLNDPTMIFSNIAIFCPSKAFTERLKKKSNITIENFNYPQWQDYSAMFTIGKRLTASKVVSTDQNFAISTTSQSGIVKIYCSSSKKEVTELLHGEKVFDLQFSHSGILLATYGPLKTKLWDITTGNLRCEVPNPRGRNLLALMFSPDDSKLLSFCTDFILREVELKQSAQSWETVRLPQNNSESGIPSPSCAAFDKTGRLLSIGYVNHPMEVWELDPPRRQAQYDHGGHANVDLGQLSWDQTSKRITGLQRDGTILVWDISNSSSLYARQGNGLSMQCSLADDLLVTRSKNGGLELLRASDLETVRQINDSRTLGGLSIEPSGGRIYGVRGSDCMIWEPTLMKIAANIEGRETYQLQPLSSQIISSSQTKPTRVSALAVCADSTTYCAGFTNGNVKIFPHGGPDTILDSPSNEKIEHLLWSCDKKYLAIVDIAAEVFIKAYDNDRCILRPYITTSLDLNIDQLLFDQQSQHIVIVAEGELIMWSLDAGSLVSRLSPVAQGCKWFNHPEKDDLFVGYGPQCIEIFSWKGLERRMTIPVDGYLSQSSFVLDLSYQIQDNPSTVRIYQSDISCEVEDLLHSLDGSVILVNMAWATASYKRNSQFLTIPTTNIDLDTPQPERGIMPHPLIENISKIMAAPLGFVSSRQTAEDQNERPRERLVFLDHDNCICSVPIHPGNREYSITRHLPLPDHFCLPESLKLCQLTSKGYIYIPVSDQAPVIKNIFQEHI